MNYVYQLMIQVVCERMRILGLDEKMEREMHDILALVRQWERAEGRNDS